MNKRQAWRQFVQDAPDLSWLERATLRFAAITRWDDIETLLDNAAAEKAGVDVAAIKAPGAPTIDWLALLMELLPIILKFFFNKSAAIALMLIVFGASMSNAQMVCANGKCQLLRTTAAVATAPVRAVANVVTYPARYAAVSSASGYGSAGTPVVQSYGCAGGSTYQSSERWRLGDRIRENIAARQSSRAASYGYGSAGGSVQSYGCTGTPVMLLTVPAVNQNCTCNPCNCSSRSVPVAPPVPLTQHAPPITLPPEQAVRELYVQVFPR